MCLAIPGRVISIEDSLRKSDEEPLMGKVDFGGIMKSVCLDLVPDVKLGEFVIVHVGFAISKMDEAEANETIKLLNEMGDAAGEPPDRNSGNAGLR